jgi:hypothetical protein
MDKVQKPSDSECYTTLLENFRFHKTAYFLRSFRSLPLSTRTVDIFLSLGLIFNEYVPWDVITFVVDF